jgi:hypothetical protein
MPKFKPNPVSFSTWLLLVSLACGLLFVAASALIATTLAILIICVSAGLTRREIKREEEQIRALAAARAGESICEFARNFDLQVVDTWIVRAVYEQIQEQLRYVHPAFPVRASDRFKEDLHLEDDDLDMDLAIQVEQRTGRSLNDTKINPYLGKVKTVQDLVFFFQAQPKHGAV